jgi:hypothetical protein
MYLKDQNRVEKEGPMATSSIDQITIVYRGETQQFATVSLALHFLRQDQIKTGWFRKIKVDVDLIVDGEVSHNRRHLEGDKLQVMKELQHLEAELKQAKA